MTQNLAQTILVQLLHDDLYAKKALPFIKEEYFEQPDDRHVFAEIKAFRDKYNVLPTVTALRLQLDQTPGLTQQTFDRVLAAYDRLEGCTVLDPKTHEKWLLDQTEEFCKERALHNAVVDSITIMDKEPERRHAIPDILRTALSVGFDNRIGHDYLEDAESRYEYYHRKDVKIPFDIDFFNEITNDGISPKTLQIIRAGTNVGKSIVLCHFAASYLKAGKNVVYITLEMAEEEIAKRIDANLLDYDINHIDNLPHDAYIAKLQKLRSQHNVGRLIIKEYPTGQGHVGHFGHLLDELALKKNFVPHVLLVDYMDICASTRYKPGSQTNTNTFLKGVSEELRGLGQARMLPVWTAAQFNRGGYSSSDPGLEHSSDSFGTNMTADLVVGLITNEELEQGGLIMAKQLKNRYGDVARPRKAVIRLDKTRMRLSNAPQDAAEYISGRSADDDDEDETPTPVSQMFRRPPTERNYANLKT